MTKESSGPIGTCIEHFGQKRAVACSTCYVENPFVFPLAENRQGGEGALGDKIPSLVLPTSNLPLLSLVLSFIS